MCVASNEPQEGATKDSSDKLPTNLNPGYVEREPQDRIEMSGLYGQERGRGNAAPKATGVNQMTATSSRAYPTMPEKRDHAIRSIEARVNERNSSGGSPSLALTAANVVGNLFADRMIRSLQAGNDPVYGAGGNVTGTRNQRGELVEGRDDLTVGGTTYSTIAEANNARDRIRRQNDDSATVETPDRPVESATNPVTPDGNRRSMIALNQARSGADSRGPGRRSLFG